MDGNIDGNLGGLLWLHLDRMSKKIVEAADGDLPDIDEEVRWLRVLSSNVVAKDPPYDHAAERLREARDAGCPEEFREDLWNLELRFEEAEALVTSLCRKGVLQTQALPHGRRMSSKVFEQ